MNQYLHRQDQRVLKMCGREVLVKGLISQAPLVVFLLSDVVCQGCAAPLRGFALDALQYSANLLAGGLRVYHCVKYNYFVIRDFIMAHREEVKDMLLTEYNEASSHELFQLEGERIGREKGLKEGADGARLEDIRTAMQKLNLSADAAMDFFDIPQELREKYAKEL
jgi:hypothetical protein